MLPKIKNSLIAGLAAVTLVTGAAAPALAWGKKEQGFVAGAATAIIVDQMIRNGQHRKQHQYQPPRHVAPPQYYHAPQYVTPRQTFVEPRQTYSSSVYSTPAAVAFKSYSAVERRAIQRRLKAAGYYFGSIDGAFGPGTYNAIVAYARDNGASANLRSTNGAFAVYDSMLF